MFLFKTLFRYFARSFLFWFMVFTVGMAAIVWVVDFSEFLRRFSSRPDVSFGFIAQLSLLHLPDIIEQLLPFLVFFSAMFVLWKFNRQSEICVIRAAGLSVWQFTAPLVIMALFIGIFDLFVFNPISATLTKQFMKLEGGEKTDLSISETGIWLNFKDHKNPVIMRIGRADIATQKATDVSILKFDQDDEVAQRYDAQNATFTKGGLMLSNVWESSFHQPPVHQSQLFYESTLTLAQLQKMNRPPETLSFWQLPSFIKLLHKSGLPTVKYALYWQSMLARVIWLIGMVMLAATCTLRPLRLGQHSIFILSAIGIGFSLYFIHKVTYTMGLASALPVGPAAWIPVVLSGMIGVATLLHMEEH